MKLHVYVAFNGYLECSGQPKFDDHEPAVFTSSFKRHLMTAEDEKVFQFENVSWYHIGDYDDETMELVSMKTPIKLLDCNKVLEQRKIKAKLLEASRKIDEKKEGEIDGQKE